MARQLFLDTETTGHEAKAEGKIVELAVVEMDSDNREGGEGEKHWRLNPGCDVTEQAYQIHGLSRSDLADQPPFSAIVDEFLEFVRGAELLMHNASFDVEFVNKELEEAGCQERIEDICEITDTLAMARNRHPGQRNSLQALCQRYGIEASEREKRHGALIDAILLRQVYRAMMSGQTTMAFEGRADQHGELKEEDKLLSKEDRPSQLRVIEPSVEEMKQHLNRMKIVAEHSDKGVSVWPLEEDISQT